VARAADEGGFDIVAVMDHLFQIGMIGPPEQDMLEAYTTLAFLAGHTSRARLIALVSGVSLRGPGILMKQVSTLDVLSGGRAMLGIGAGWFENEAVSLGLPFPPVGVRFEQLEEQLQIAHRMFSGSEEPFEGKHYLRHDLHNCWHPVARERSQPHSIPAVVWITTGAVLDSSTTTRYRMCLKVQLVGGARWGSIGSTTP
jgi:alkanesulfonate monooxygenase SsuD/methylene tetrahydromethanopterin reductase-like flavin-dependent oxidoreductase (luciferase family)